MPNRFHSEYPESRNDKLSQSSSTKHSDESSLQKIDATPSLSQDKMQEVADDVADSALVNELARAIKRESFNSELSPVPLPLLQNVITTVRSQRELETAIHPSGLPDKAITVATGSDQVAGQGCEFDIESRLLGSYRILRRLGQGGMGVVFEAEDLALKRFVAIKLMNPSAAAIPENRIRFIREAQAAAKVAHDYICPIYQVGESDGMPYIAMPLLQGETLEQRMNRAFLTLGESLEVLRQTAEGMAAAHAAGLVHRDIKPANIWLEKKTDGAIRVRILDFGLARCEVEESMTLTGMVVGTPAYMAPEQARGEAVDARADLFSLGAVAYQMVSGKRAFSGSGTLEVLTKIINHDPNSLESETPDVPKSLSDLVKQLLQKNIEERTSSAQVLVEQVKRIQREIPLRVSQAFPSTNQTTSKHPAATTNATTQRSANSGRRAKLPRLSWLVWAGSIAFLILLGVLIFRTPNGTLVVEFDDSTDIRVKNGQLQVHDEQGELRYSLQPSARQQQIAAGTYSVLVTGADGLTVDTDKFEMKRGETVIVRVTAKPNSEPERPYDPNSSIPAANIVHFPGKSIINEEFENPSLSQLPISSGNGQSKQITNGVYTYALDVSAAQKNLTLPIGNQLKKAAFIVQCRTTNGYPFINVCTLNDEQKSRYLSLALSNGGWQLYLARQDFEEGSWVLKPSTLLASENFIDPLLMPGQWIEVAARWSGEDYDLWLNGKHVAGGEMPNELHNGNAGPIQICAKSASAGVTTIQLASLKVWDQSEIEPSKTAPTGLPTRSPQ